MENLANKIEALLFLKGEPISHGALMRFFKADAVAVNTALSELEEKLSGHSLTLLHKEGEVALGTRPEFGPMFEAIRKEELGKELSKASLETLAIVLYRGGVSRAEIDFIRGVNSSFILRNLSIRGLVEKKPHPEDSRKNIYTPSFETLSYLGVSGVEKLPEYEKLNEAIAEGAKNSEENRNETS